MAISLVTDAQATAINADFASLAETFRTITNPDDITVVRQGGTTIGTFSPLSLRFDDRQAVPTGGGTPVAETEQDGTLKLWAADVAAAPIRIGDRFLWGTQHCVISTTAKPRLGGVVAYGFTVEVRN
jgi:hypothetical protein